MSDIGMMSGGRTRARTCDPLIKSQLLYQLSYAPISKKNSYLEKVCRTVRHR